MGAKEWPLSKQWYVAVNCRRCKRAATNGVFNEPDEVRHRRDEHVSWALGILDDHRRR